MTIDVEALRSGLADEQRELQDAIEQGERRLAEQDDEGVRAGLELQRSQLRKVEHALARHADGTWQQCEACGEPIGDAQIRVLPTATHCEQCAEDQVYWGDTQAIRLDELDLDQHST